MIAIFAADSEWGIGRGGRLPWRLPGDLAYFRERTAGGVVIMGRRTFESIAADTESEARTSRPGADAGPSDLAAGPAPRPLPGRTNVVLTRDAGYTAEGVIVVHSTDELLGHLRRLGRRSDIYVCGGADIYRLLMPYTDVCLVTRIEGAFGADTFFPVEEESEDGSGFTALCPEGAARRFVLESESAPVTESDLRGGRAAIYRFCEYRASTV
jgi:dihydrofolate reductase